MLTEIEGVAATERRCRDDDQQLQDELAADSDDGGRSEAIGGRPAVTGGHIWPPDHRESGHRRN